MPEVLLNMSFTRVPLSEALRYITQLSHLDLKIEGNTAIISPHE